MSKIDLSVRNNTMGSGRFNHSTVMKSLIQAAKNDLKTGRIVRTENRNGIDSLLGLDKLTKKEIKYIQNRKQSYLGNPLTSIISNVAGISAKQQTPLPIINMPTQQLPTVVTALPMNNPLPQLLVQTATQPGRNVITAPLSKSSSPTPAPMRFEPSDNLQKTITTLQSQDAIDLANKIARASAEAISKASQKAARVTVQQEIAKGNIPAPHITPVQQTKKSNTAELLLFSALSALPFIWK